VSTTKSDLFQLFTKIDMPYGKTYGAWTVKWWQWALSSSKESSAVNDPTGHNSNINQPSTDVLFLAGNIAYINKNYPHRNISIEYGRSILIPVLNCEANSLEYPKLKEHDDLIRHVEHDVSTVVKKDLIINGISLESVRVQSDPRIFKVTINEDNAFGINNPGSVDAAADGYWTFIKPLPRGRYTISLEGSCESGRLNAGASYDVKIV
jgi:hypothetical protein